VVIRVANGLGVAPDRLLAMDHLLTLSAAE
jgi:hypothetical protein